MGPNPNQPRDRGRLVNLCLISPGVHHGGDHRRLASLATENVRQVFVPGRYVIEDFGGGPEMPLGFPARDWPDWVVVKHQGVVNVVKDLSGMTSEDFSVERSEKPSLDDDSMILSGGLEKLPEFRRGKQSLGPELDIEIEAAVGQQGGERRDPQSERRLRKIVDQHQNPLHPARLWLTRLADAIDGVGEEARWK